MTAGPHAPFSIGRFTLATLAQFALLLLGFRFLAPRLWASQLGAGWLALALTFAGLHMGLGFFEWAFHRYVLHMIPVSWLRVFTDAHRNHHGLTAIKLQPVAQGSDRYVLNRYPIVEEAQHEDSAFPWYALLGFWAFFTPAIVGLQLLLPHLPVLIGGYAAVTWSLALYEILHAIEHRPYEWWKQATEHPRFGTLWKKVYGFHHMHHANVSCNEAIGGFFGLPVADWAFGTYHQPRELLLEGRLATAKDFAVPAPPGLVAWIDRWARAREAKVHRRAA